MRTKALEVYALAQRYGLTGLADARAYLRHPVLGSRLRTSVELLLATRGLSAHDIFGSPDDLKLRSSLTLFREADSEKGLFSQALDKFFEGKPDAATLRLLSAMLNKFGMDGEGNVHVWANAFAQEMRILMTGPDADLHDLLEWGRDLYDKHGHRHASDVAREVWRAVGDPVGRPH